MSAARLSTAYAFRAGVPLRLARMNTNTIHASYHPITSQKLRREEEEESDSGVIHAIIGAVRMRDTVAAAATNAVDIATIVAHNLTSYVSSIELARRSRPHTTNAKSRRLQLRMHLRRATVTTSTRIHSRRNYNAPGKLWHAPSAGEEGDGHGRMWRKEDD